MDWKDIRSGIAQYFGDSEFLKELAPDELLVMSEDTEKRFLGPIDWSWGKDDIEISQKLAVVETIYDFRCNQVESLIQEAGMLIDRSLGDLLRYDALNVERFKILLEFTEYDLTKAQQEAEQADDAFWKGLVAEADLAAQSRTHQSDRRRI